MEQADAAGRTSVQTLSERQPHTEAPTPAAPGSAPAPAAGTAVGGPTDLRTIYNTKYRDERVRGLKFRGNPISTTRYDDVHRLLRGERGAMLDFGCGSGQLLFAHADQFDRLAGVDLATVRVERARAMLQERYPHLAHKMSFHVAEGESPLPFADGEFDVVTAIAVIEHVVDVFFVMDELARVCRPGGVVVVNVPNYAYVRNALILLMGDIPLTGTHTRDMQYWRECGWDGGHLHAFSKPALAALLRHVGLEPEEWTGDGRWARLRRWYINFVGSMTVRARKPKTGMQGAGAR